MTMSRYQVRKPSHFQTDRQDKYRPSVVRGYGAWWARVFDIHTGEFKGGMFHALPDAYNYAVELANANAPQEPTA